MRDLNKVIVSGRATKDAEYKEVNGLKIASFTLACNYDDDSGFFQVDCFGGLAENVAARFITKGKEISIEGWLKQSRFITRDGQGVSRITIVAQKILLKGGKEQCLPRNARNAASN